MLCFVFCRLNHRQLVVQAKEAGVIKGKLAPLNPRTFPFEPHGGSTGLWVLPGVWPVRGLSSDVAPTLLCTQTT